MDRTIVYPGAIPLDTDILNIQRDAMVAIGYLAQCTLGTNIVADGLACTPISPGGMTVNIGPGSITLFTVIDQESFGSLAAEVAEPLVKMGVNTASTALNIAAPGVTGQAITYLIQAALLESDGQPVLLPYYNAANPSTPYSGPNNDGLAQNTRRLQSVQLQLKAGPPAALGTQTVPNADAGWVGLYTVTVIAGQTAIVSANIAVLPTAPFLQWKLPDLAPGTSHLSAFTPANQGNWTVPAGITAVRVRVWGGGGAGGAGFGGAGGGGAGGGYAEGYFAVTPGQTIRIAVGSGGTGSGGSGGTTTFGSLISATGGGPGDNGGTGSVGAGSHSPGSGAGGAMAMSGQMGSAAFELSNGWFGGSGGGCFGSGGGIGSLVGTATNANGAAGVLAGSGGAGGVGSGVGGEGGAGLALIEW